MMHNILHKISLAFEKSGLKDPKQQAKKLLTLLPDERIEEIDLNDLIKKRQQGMPLEYILEKAEFMGRTFNCTHATFIPRQETELLVKIAIEIVCEIHESNPDEITVIDMGTGTGNIAITFAYEFDNIRILALDINQSALDIAKKNVEKHKVDNKVSLHCGDFFKPIENLGLENRVDLVIFNPPYIPSASISKMPREIIEYEPREAFEAGAFGIDFFRRIINESLLFLKPGGVLAFEIGMGQEKLVTRIFDRKPDYSNIGYHHNEENQVRAISVRKL